MLRRMPYPVFDDVIHEPHRLRICAMLVPSAGTDSPRCATSRAVATRPLSKHLKALPSRAHPARAPAPTGARSATARAHRPPAERRCAGRGRRAADGWSATSARPPRRAAATPRPAAVQPAVSDSSARHDVVPDLAELVCELLRPSAVTPGLGDDSRPRVDARPQPWPAPPVAAASTPGPAGASRAYWSSLTRGRPGRWRSRRRPRRDR